ncbi:hypothetical protein PH210_05155 [Paenibacillus sp. BSR1-1]|nr:hypothetical protein [Paenibacillus sp. BSR1-1]
MNINIGNIQNTFGLNNFKTMKETSKAVEFKNIVKDKVIYFFPNKEITIVLNPKNVEENKELRETIQVMDRFAMGMLINSNQLMN